MKTKIVPFDLEMAKKIQAGEIEGKIVNRQTETVRIFTFDVKNKKCIVGAVEHALSEGEYIAEWDAKGRAFDNIKESFLDLLIELPEEAPEYHHPIEESELYQTGYKAGFEAGKCVAFDEKKECAIKKEISKHGFKPFDKVLMRDENGQLWRANIFSHVLDGSSFPYACAISTFRQCIPYDGNEELVGTTKKPEGYD